VPHPANPNLAFDAVAVTRVNASTVILSRTKAGKLLQTVTDVVSPDGKTWTATVIGTDANGRPVMDVIVYDKQ
jgi:uncharacterized phosphosugar-binding protein